MVKLNNKAIVFTFITVVLLSVVIIAFLINLNTQVSQNKIQSTNIKIETINSFVRNLNSTYIPDALKVSSNQVMISLLDYESNNTYVASINDYFKQVLNDGNYNNIFQSDMSQNGVTYTLTNALNEIKNLANRQGVVFNSQVDYNTLTITQKNPWHITISLKISYTVNDNNNEESWNINNRYFYYDLNVQDYRDPLYLVEEDPGISLQITKSAYGVTDFQNINNFKSHIANSWFIDNQAAPSFLNRLEQGKNNVPSENGIESIIDPGYYPNSNSYSNADYQFYSHIVGLCVKDMPENFKLDQSHINYYSRTNC